MRLSLVVLGPLDRRSGGYSYDVDLVEHLTLLGHHVEVWSLPAGSRRAAEALARHLETESPDCIVFDALVHPGITRLLELVRPRFQNPWVALVHHLAWLEDTRSGFKTRGKQKREHRFLEAMDGFLFNSLDTSRSVAELRGPEAPFKPSLICRPPLRAAPGTSSPTAQGRLLFLGNLVPRKNLDGLLMALALVLRRRPELSWSLTVAGSPDLDPGYARKCRRLAEAAGLADRVVWAGRVDEEEREALWARTDLLVLPSFHEGWGMAHAEALVRGVVALAVPQGGVTEVLGNAGLWSSSDAPALSLAVERFLDNPDVREDLARKARLRGNALLAGGTGFGALGSWLESLAESKGGGSLTPSPFDFEAYLEAKAEIDSRSLHPRVAEAAFSGGKPARILELGGGTGTMAQRLLEGGKAGPETAYELVDLDAEGLASARRRCEGLFLPGHFVTRQTDLLAFCEQNAGSRPDLVVAHAVLDLFDAATAALALAALEARRYWLTHLFDGLTAWEPVIDHDLDRRLVEAYHLSMDERAPGRGEGSSRSGREWLQALPRAGLQVLDAAASDWIVRPARGAYSSGEAVFLRSLLHFFRSSLSVRCDVDQAGLAWWLAVREAQIKRGEAVLVAHQLDLVAQPWEISP